MKLFVKNLTNVDFSFLDSDRGLMGESWLAQLELDGDLDNQGMICDFSIVKRKVRDWLDTYVDHRLVLPLQSEQLEVSTKGDYLNMEWTYLNGSSLVCSAPSEAMALVDKSEITARSLADWCQVQLLELFADEVKGLKLEFVPEPTTGAFYHYSHGLQKHDGNCQRIAHGHRSNIEIFIDNVRDHDLEKSWAQSWKDIYLGSVEHLVEQKNGNNLYAYTAPQGDFMLSLPTDRCDDLEEETTVEKIAQHIAKKVKLQYPDSLVAVKAFEGIGKGAIAEY